MTLALARRRPAALLVAFLLAIMLAFALQTGAVPVPGAPEPAAAHAEEWGWVPCAAGMAAQWGQLGFVAYEWHMGHDWELAGATIYFSVWAMTSGLTGWECVNHVLENDDDTCYIYQQTQQGNFIVGETAPNWGTYATFTCQWNY